LSAFHCQPAIPGVASVEIGAMKDAHGNQVGPANGTNPHQPPVKRYVGGEVAEYFR
jgi:hypothetical protein